MARAVLKSSVMRTYRVGPLVFLFSLSFVSSVVGVACGGRTDQLGDLGQKTGTGSGTGSGTGTHVGSGSGTGTHVGSGSGTGTYVGSGSGTGTYVGSGSGTGTYVGSGSGSGTGTYTGSGSGSGSGCVGEQPLCPSCGQPQPAECTADGWYCPPPPPCPPPEDAGVMFAFPCGPDLSCDATTTYCNVSNGGIAPPDGGSDTSYECVPFPPECGQSPSCACLASNGGACSCSEGTLPPGPPDIIVTCNYP